MKTSTSTSTSMTSAQRKAASKAAKILNVAADAAVADVADVAVADAAVAVADAAVAGPDAAVAGPVPLVSYEQLLATNNALLAQLASNTKQRSASGNKSAKQFIRELLSVDGACMSVDQLCSASGKTAVNVITALSDLRSARYAGSDGVFVTKSQKIDGVTSYLKA